MFQQSKQKNTKTLILTVGLLVVFAFVFLIVFVIMSTSTGDAPSLITEDTYLSEVTMALDGADPTQGEQLIEDQNCAVCHVLGDGTVAPLFTGIANVADERRPPLSAEQYLYEAIVHPDVFLLDGYTNSMPNNYDDLLSQQEVGHIIAYLMTLSDTE